MSVCSKAQTKRSSRYWTEERCPRHSRRSTGIASIMMYVSIQWNLRQGTLRDRDDLSTKDTCFNPMLIFKYNFDLRDRDHQSLILSVY